MLLRPSVQTCLHKQLSDAQCRRAARSPLSRQGNPPSRSRPLPLLILLGRVRHCQRWHNPQISHRYFSHRSHATLKRESERTRRQTLLQLIGLVGVLEDKGVEEAVASDLELDVVGLCAALYPAGCEREKGVMSVRVLLSLRYIE